MKRACSRYRAMRMGHERDRCLFCGMDYRSHLVRGSRIVLAHAFPELFFYNMN